MTVISDGLGSKLFNMGTPASYSFDEILSACVSQEVTGVLRVRDIEADSEAEIHFLSGVQDSVRLGHVEGEEALARISLMANPEFSATQSLPPMSESSQTAFPKSGSLGDFRPVDLMRYCEVRCLTCTLHLQCADRQIKAIYKQGDLVSVEPELELTISVLEALEGTYRFELPPFELPNMAAPRAFDPEAANDVEAQAEAADSNAAQGETSDCAPNSEDEAVASSKEELKFTSIAAPPPDSSMAMDDTQLAPRSDSEALQPPPPRASEEHDVFASLSPELLQQVLGEPAQTGSPSLSLPRLAAYAAATLLACATLAFLSYSFLAPLAGPPLDSPTDRQAH